MVNVRYTPSMLKVCINKWDDYTMQGNVYSILLEDPISYSSWAEFLLKIDAMFDQTGYPQSFQHKRSFKEETPTTTNLFTYVEPVIREDVPFQTETGEVCTMILEVHSREHASWQGALFTEDHIPVSSFDSELEVIKLINGFVRNK